MPIIAFNHYNLRADRVLMEELKAFYCDVLGLEQGYRPPFDSFGYWLYVGGQAILHLSETRGDEVRETGIATTFDHVAFSCAGREEMESRLRQCDIPFTVAHVPMTGQVQLFLQDPAGNRIELNFSE